jgi:ABC-type branched-subunit amino acid transport system ATPase component
MTVRQNVEIGVEARRAGRNPLRQFTATRGDRASVTAAVDEAIERCGLGAIADDVVATLPTGRRRLVELARVLASGFSMLLLDEPSSGLDEEETAAFAEILTDTVDDLGTGILLVEHDMSLVMKVCRQIHVIDFGTLILSGTPAQVQASDAVRAAYLGTEPIDAAAS